MGFWKRLFRPSEAALDKAIDDAMRNIDQNIKRLSVPHDQELWDLAKKRKDHVSLRAVSDEYDRLVLKKYG